MKIKRLFFNNRVKVVFLFQLITIFVAQIISLALTTNFNIKLIFEPNVVLGSLMILGIRAILLYSYKLHHGLWRYTNSNDIVRIVKSTTLGSATYILITYFLIGPNNLLSIIVVDWVFIIFCLTGIRFTSRLIREGKVKTPKSNSMINNQKNLLIIGAGDAGINLCKNIRENQKINYLPVAFADDDENKLGSYILDIPVAGKVEELSSIISRFQIETAVFAIPSATTKQKSKAIQLLSASGIKFEILPSTPDVLAGNVSTNKIREVNPLDILGRPPTKLNSEVLNKFINDKCILITGAGGSVGSDLARQTSKYNPKKLIILDQIENPLLFLESEIKSEYPKINLITLISDVTDNISIGKILSAHKPNVILHAAAHKHVPFMETNPTKAIKNNVGGTLTIALSAIKNNVGKFVFVSTDKAANPSSVMGSTKRIGELLLNQLNQTYTQTNFVSVRFGNVFGSNASVVPIFKKQIESGGPVTVTHPQVTRYFMSIQEATGLILQAGAIANGGEIFVLDMGTPIKIIDLAKTLISIYGLEDQIDIKFTGLRRGEKLHEILNTEFEVLEKTRHSRILTIKSNQNQDNVITSVNELLENLNDMSHKELIQVLKKIVPNYTPLS